jgi:large subunit ribosomal protein L30
MEKHRRTIRALGLGKIDSEVIQNDSPQIRGMIKQVSYLVDVEEVKE